MRFVRIVVIAALALVIVPDTARAATTSKLVVVGIAGDNWYNYDFLDQTVSSSNVDWPVMMLFTNNATINKVKTAYQPWYPKTNNTSKKAYMSDGGLSLWVWDTDNGIKLSGCPPTGWFEHMRVYAPPTTNRMYNTSYGYWIMATTHFDGNDGCSGEAFGYSETAQGWFVQNARTIWGAAAVSENCCWMFNQEPLRYEGNHIWESNGYASYIRVP